MSTVTLSKPHCAITSAEKPDGIASQALTTALPDAQTSFTLLAIIVSSPVFKLCRHSRAPRLAWTRNSRRTEMLLDSELSAPRNDNVKSRRRLLYASFAHPNLAGGGHNRSPGVIRQGHAVRGALGAHFPFGIAGNQHGIDAGHRLGRAYEVGITRDFAVEEI